MTAYPGLLDFYVREGDTCGVVVGWRDGLLIVMTDSRRLVMLDPGECEVVGKAVLTVDDESDESEPESESSGPDVACA